MAAPDDAEPDAPLPLTARRATTGDRASRPADGDATGAAVDEARGDDPPRDDTGEGTGGADGGDGAEPVGLDTVNRLMSFLRTADPDS